ncbi:pseudouridine synthase [Paucibacter sp. AS339]|uniref:pseudouridine synthase n=1 Tax=Paucibacter hankyongi TaxID=3133434 RepID=UPI0030A5099F
MATLKLNKKNAGPPGSGKRGPDAERRAPIRGKGVSRPRQSLEAAKAEREQRQAQFEARRGSDNRGGPAGRPSDRGDQRAESRGPRGPGGPGAPRGPRDEGHGAPARDGWRNQGPRFESRSEQGFRGREQPRFEGRPEFRDDGRGPQSRSYEGRDARYPQDSRDPREQRDYRGPRDGRDPRASGGFDSRGPSGPRYEERRPAYGQGQGQQSGRGYGQEGPRRHPDERGGPGRAGGQGGYGGHGGQGGPGDAGRREDRWQGQRPSYAQEPRREAPRDNSYRDQRQDQRRSSGPRPEGQAGGYQGHRANQGPGYPRGPSAADKAGQQLPAHLREAAAQLRRQLDDDDDEDGDVYIDPNSEGVRLSKQMGVLGLASRREADEWIAAGWVRVDGKLAVLGQRVSPDVKIEIDPLAHKEQAKRVTILLHKPIGYVSGQAEDGYEPASVLIKSDAQWNEDSSGIKFHIGHARGLAPAGRLDIDSTGLLVLTQDGRIAKLLIGEDSSIEKEYLVRVEYHGRDGVRSEDGRLPAADLELLNHGLELDGVKLKPAKVSWQNEDQLRFVLREGRKRQIRRMCEQVGLKVVGLKRVRIGRINLGNLPVGQWRFLTPWERFD